MQVIIGLALKQRLLMIIVFVTTLVGGLAAFRVLNIEAYPDPVPPLVDVIVQSPGLSAEEVERYITIPMRPRSPDCRTRMCCGRSHFTRFPT
jgi:cobalt-zinc-cadmium resistance protein CzcA